MAERFRRDDRAADGATTATATDRDLDRGDRFDRTDRDHGTVDHGTMVAARRRQRDEFGGINWGSAFFGWLTASGLAMLLAGLLSAAGAALALTDGGNDVTAANADTIGIGAGIALLVVVLISYFAGGYVAGRMSRFDGARQGLGVWLWFLVITAVLAAAAAIGGSEWNVLQRVDLPRLPVDEGALTTGGVITLLAIVLGTLAAAILGGKAGERYHRKVDRAAVDAR
jgi:hypothetical protein